MRTFLGSERFFYLIIGLSVVQALWYIFSFQPALFDEQKHLGRVYAYLGQLGPFFSEQKPEWDQYGQLIRDESYLFYYILSWPLRFITLFTQDAVVQINALRLVCTAFFVGGLILYRKFLFSLSQDISRSVSHVTLLLFVMTPIVAPLPGAVNYDSLAFLLFALLLLLAARVMNSRVMAPLPLLALFSLALVMTVIKWTSIALIAPVTAYVIYELVRRHKTGVLTSMVASFKNESRWRLGVALLLFLLSLGLFIERPVMNTLEYGKPKPSCFRVMERERCLKSPEIAIYAQVDANKPAGFVPDHPPEYFYKYWAPRMVNTSVSLLPWNASRLSPSLPVMELLSFALALGGVALILLYLRDYLKVPMYRFALFVLLGYTLLLFAELYRAYTLHAIPAAINARYLIPVMPIFLYFVALSVRNVFGEHRNSLLVLLVVVLVALTQGGGMVTNILTAKEGLYWPNEAVRGINREVVEYLQPLVKE